VSPGKFGVVTMSSANIVAHELGHGLAGFSDNPYDGDDEDDLMTYGDPPRWRLRYDQWDRIRTKH
jgi:hypothetical protein